MSSVIFLRSWGGPRGRMVQVHGRRGDRGEAERRRECLSCISCSDAQQRGRVELGQQQLPRGDQAQLAEEDEQQWGGNLENIDVVKLLLFKFNNIIICRKVIWHQRHPKFS